MDNIAFPELERVKEEYAAYQGGISAENYISSADEQNEDNTIGSDSSALTSSGSSNGSSSRIGTAPAKKTESPNYISNALDTAAQADAGANDAYNGLVDDDSLYTEDPKTGYWILSEDKLDALYRQLLAACNMRLILAMIMEQKSELSDAFFQVFSDTDYSDLKSKTSLVELTAKSNQKLAKNLQRGVIALMKKVQEHNDAHYTDEKNKAEKEKGGAFSNFFTSNYYERQNREMLVNESAEYRAATEATIQTANRILGGGFKGLNAHSQATGNDVLDRLEDSSKYIKYDDNGYIDTAYTKQFLIDLRREFVGVLNENRLVASQAGQKESTVKNIREAFRGKAEFSNRMAGSEESVEAENAHQTSVFDATTSEIFRMQTLNNQNKYYENQLEKMQAAKGWTIAGNILKGVAIAAVVVLIVIASIVTFGAGAAPAWAAGAAAITALVGIGAGAGSAGCDYGASEAADAVDDKYTPSLDTFKMPTRTETKGKKGILEKSAELDYEEQRYLDELGAGQIEDRGSFKGVNYDKVAALNYKLNAILNTQRVLAKMLKQRGQKNKMMFRVFTGLSAAADSNMMIAGVEETLRQISQQSQGLASNLSEYKDAVNNITQARIEEEAASRNFWYNVGFTVTGAVIGFALGGPAGAIIGASVGQAIAQGSAGLHNASVKVDEVGSDNYNPNMDEWPSLGGSNGGLGSTQDSQLFGIYRDLLANGTVDAGDGNIGINTDKVRSLQKQMERIFITIANMISIVEGKQSTIKSLWQAFGGVTDESMSVRDLNNANFETQMKMLRYVVRMLGEHVQAHNQVNVAQRELTKAKIKFWGTLVLSAGSGITGGATGSSAIFNLCFSGVNLFQGGVDLADAIMRGSDDYGQIQEMAEGDAPSTRETPRKNLPPEWKILANQDQIEAQTTIRASDDKTTSDTEELGGGNIGINSGTMEIRSQALDRANRIKEILSDIVSQQREVLSKMARVLGGSRTAGSKSLDDAVYISGNIASSMLQTQMQAVQQFISRHNQINNAEKQIWLESFNLAMTAIQTTISIINYVQNGKGIESYENKVKAAQQAAEGLSPEAAKAKMKQLGPSPDEKKAYQKALEGKESWGNIATAIQFTQYTAEMLITYFYDHQGGNSKDPNAKSIEAKNKQNMSDRKAVMGLGGGIDRMEAEALGYSIQAGASELEMEMNEVLRNYSKELFQQVEKGIKAASNTIRDKAETREKLDKIRAARKCERAMIEYRQKLDELKKALDAYGQTFTSNNGAYVQMAYFSTTEAPSASNQALITMIEQFVASCDAMTESSQGIGASLDGFSSKADAAEKALEALAPKLAEKSGLPDALMPQEPQKLITAEDVAKLMEKLKQLEDNGQFAQTIKDVPLFGKKGDVKVSLTGVTCTTTDGKPIFLSFSEYIAQRQSADKDYNFQSDEVFKSVLQQVSDKQDKLIEIAAIEFDSTVASAGVMAKAAKISHTPEQLMSIMDATERDMKEKLLGKELGKMTEKELQAHYEELFKEIFLPAQKQLQRAIKEKAQILAKMREAGKDGLDEVAKAALGVKLDEALAAEGEARTKIKSFELYIGQVNSAFRAKTGHDLTPATIPVAVPETVSAASAPTTSVVAPTAGTVPSAEPVSTPAIDVSVKIKAFEKAREEVVKRVGELARLQVEFKSSQAQLVALLEQPKPTSNPAALLAYAEQIEQAAQKCQDLAQKIDAQSASVCQAVEAVAVQANEIDQVLLTQNPQFAQKVELPKSLIPLEVKSTTTSAPQVPIQAARAKVAEAKALVQLALKAPSVDDLRAIIPQVQAQFATMAQAIQTFTESAYMSPVMTAVSEVEGQADPTMSAPVKQKSQEILAGRKLSDLKPEELQRYYEQVYQEVFVPARTKLMKTIAEKQVLLAKIKSGEKSLEPKLQEVMAREAWVRAAIRSFNHHIGEVNRLYQEKTKGGQLKPVAVIALAETVASGKLVVEEKGLVSSPSTAAGVDVQEVEAQFKSVIEETDKGLIRLEPKERKTVQEAIRRMEKAPSAAHEATVSSAAAQSGTIAEVKKKEEKKEVKISAKDMLAMAEDLCSRASGSLEQYAREIKAADQKIKTIEGAVKQEAFA